MVYEPFPASDEPVDFTNVSHGSRLRRREVSLVFNAVDSAEGLTRILNTLSAYKVRATFFVNGEFIRRYPDAVREIADSGHEVGSLFYAYFNMTDARFTVDSDFVKTGLARNEDDYYAATGRELSLLWHAPYYIVNSGIIAAAAEMNYTYVGRDLDSYDWVAATESNQARGIYMRAADLVERIVAQKKPGSIIPLQVGAGEGRRDDYLFQKLDILINELDGTRVRHRAGLHADRGCALRRRSCPRHGRRERGHSGEGTGSGERLQGDPDQDGEPDTSHRHALRWSHPSRESRLDAFAEGHRGYDVINNHLIAAQDILSELMASLDFDKGGVLAKNLFSLYSFMNRRLLDGNLKKDAAPLTRGEEDAERPSRGLGRDLHPQGAGGEHDTDERGEHRRIGDADAGRGEMDTIEKNVAVLKRLRAMLARQREKFDAYLRLLECEGEAIENGDSEKLLAQVEMEKSIIAEIFTLKRVIAPLESLYQAAYPAGTEIDDPASEVRPGDDGRRDPRPQRPQQGEAAGTHGGHAPRDHAPCARGRRRLLQFTRGHARADRHHDMSRELCLIDGYSVIYRGYFAFLNRPLLNPMGRNSSSVFVFFRTLFQILRDRAPESIVVAMDSRVPTFRHLRYEEYKATREKAPEDLHAQVPVIEEILEALRVPCVRADGYEADDVIATLAESCRATGRPVLDRLR